MPDPTLFKATAVPKGDYTDLYAKFAIDSASED